MLRIKLALIYMLPPCFGYDTNLRAPLAFLRVANIPCLPFETADVTKSSVWTETRKQGGEENWLSQQRFEVATGT